MPIFSGKRIMRSDLTMRDRGFSSAGLKYWEVVADKLSAAGWSWGYCSAVTRDGWRWTVDAYRGTVGVTLSNLTNC